MKIIFIYRILPVIILYLDYLVPENFAGVASAMFISIRKKSKDDKGLLEHEIAHVRQFYRTFGLHSILYLFSEKYRLNAEIEAYRAQLKTSPEDIDRFATFVATKYDINIKRLDARDMLNPIAYAWYKCPELHADFLSSVLSKYDIRLIEECIKSKNR